MKITFLTKDELIISKVKSFLEEWNNDIPFFITETSGSTGKPKFIQIEKKHAIQSAKNTIQFLGLTPNDISLLCLNPDTIGGKMMLVRALVLNQPIIIGDVNANPLEMVDEPIDFIAIAPIQLQGILENNPEKLSTIKKIIVGGGIISESLISLTKKNQITVYQTFGMTETISHIALRKVGIETDERYHLVPNISISTIDNQLVITAPSLGIKELKTTDIVEIVDDNSFKWLGRSDFVINSGGVKIHPEKVEALLGSKINAPFFITSEADEKLGEIVVLVIEKENHSIDNQWLEKSFYASLPKYHSPKKVSLVSSFIRTASGKINRIETVKNLNLELAISVK